MCQGDPFRDSEGKVIKYYGTWTDIHNQKNSQSEIEQALQIRDEFLSIASHELKTPLTSLKLQLQMAQRDFKNGTKNISSQRTEKAVDIAVEQVKRLETLVDNLLDITRIKSGKLNFHYSETNLSEVVIDTVQRFRDIFENNSSPVETNIQSGLMVSCDAFRIEQVITNLLSNAVKYGSGKLIQISLEKDEGWVKLIVKDHGIGIEKKMQSIIFDRFERAASDNNISGLGLGLFIVTQILTGHKATIEVESEVMKGSSFIVRLPLL